MLGSDAFEKPFADLNAANTFALCALVKDSLIDHWRHNSVLGATVDDQTGFVSHIQTHSDWFRHETKSEMKYKRYRTQNWT